MFATWVSVLPFTKDLIKYQSDSIDVDCEINLLLANNCILFPSACPMTVLGG